MTPQQRRKHIQDLAAKIVDSIKDERIPLAMAVLAAMLACRALLDMMMERASYPDGPGGFPSCAGSSTAT
jgi:hypothetical protein